MAQGRIALLFLTALLAAPRVGAGQTAATGAWQRWECALESTRDYASPVADVTLRVTFTGPGGKAFLAHGFWDGGRTFRIRCAFPERGMWRWRTECSDRRNEGLHGRSGSVRVTAYRGGNPLYAHGFVRVSDNRRYLCHADGTPFLWMGDTAWAGPFRATDADWEAYLNDRAKRRFTVVQVGPAMDWAGEKDASGNAPFDADMVDRPSPAFWQGYERKIQRANEKGLFVLMVGLMEPRKRYPGSAEARAFARWIVARLYGNFVAFSPSFDSGYRTLGDDVGRAIRETTTRHLITQHPGTTTGASTNTIAEQYFDRPYMDFAGDQSGHNGGRRDLCARQAIEWNLHLYRREPHKPVVNLEAMYDTEGRDRRGAFTADDARSLGWRSWLSGAMGYTYGTDLYQWIADRSKPEYWRQAMALPSATQMTHLRDFLAAIDWWRLEPKHEMISNQPTSPTERVTLARSTEGDLLVAYIPQGDRVEIDMAGMRGKMEAHWYDPVAGTFAGFKAPVATQGAQTLRAPRRGEWVLLLKSVSQRRSARTTQPRRPSSEERSVSRPTSSRTTATRTVRFSRRNAPVETYDYFEVTVNPAQPPAGNPFVGASVSGVFGPRSGKAISVDGFCDAPDGSVYRIRFMPTQPGEHTYSVAYRADGVETTHTGTFTARASRRKGLLRVDAEHPWHFVWQGTAEHYFWNGTTTYAMLGLREDLIPAAIDRLARLKVNRIRAALYPPRVKDGQAWHEPVYPSDEFSPITNPWVAARPESLSDPGFDVTRFNVEHWRKYERLLQHAREKDVVVSVIFYVDGARPGTEPFGKARAGGDDEQRYYRYGAARLAAFSNVTWDITNEYHLFRDEAWVNKMARFLRQCDPYSHLMSVHGHGEFPFRSEPWADFAMYQSWDEGGGHAFMLANREKQEKAGRVIPQINEEYGYEDHYPHWGNDPTVAPARNADNRRRLAWGMVMAGCYQTTGERANDGKGGESKQGGGWITGRGDTSMTMLDGYAHMVEFFTGLDWWKLEPHDELVDGGAMCLAEPGRCYVVYQPQGKAAVLKPAQGRYAARRFDPRTGRYTDLGQVSGPEWTCPASPDGGDSAVLVRRR